MSDCFVKLSELKHRLKLLFQDWANKEKHACPILKSVRCLYKPVVH